MKVIDMGRCVSYKVEEVTRFNQDWVMLTTIQEFNKRHVEINMLISITDFQNKIDNGLFVISE